MLVTCGSRESLDRAKLPSWMREHLDSTIRRDILADHPGPLAAWALTGFFVQDPVPGLVPVFKL